MLQWKIYSENETSWHTQLSGERLFKIEIRNKLKFMVFLCAGSVILWAATQMDMKSFPTKCPQMTNTIFEMRTSIETTTIKKNIRNFEDDNIYLNGTCRLFIGIYVFFLPHHLHSISFDSMNHFGMAWTFSRLSTHQ